MLRRGFIWAVLATGITASAQGQQINYESGDWQTVWNKALEQKKILFATLKPSLKYGKLTEKERMMIDRQSYMPAPMVAEVYNKHLLSWRNEIDTSKNFPEKRYLVSGLPAAFMVDATDNRVLYRFEGAPASDQEMLYALSEAEEERKDKMTIAQYQDPLDSGTLPLPMMLKYLRKRQRLKLDNKQALHFYLVQADPDIKKVSDSTLKVAERYETSLDGTGAQYYITNIKQVYKSVHKGDTPVVQATLMRWAYRSLNQAIAERNEMALEQIVQRLGSADQVLANEKVNKLGMDFYKAMGNTSMYLSYLKRDAERLCRIPDSTVARTSDAYRAEAMKRLRKEAATKKVDPDLYLQQHLNDLDTADINYKRAAELEAYAREVGERYSHDDYTMTDAIRWIEKAIIWREGKGGDVVGMYYLYAQLLYKNQRKTEAEAMYNRFLERHNQFAWPAENVMQEWQQQWAQLTSGKQR